MAIMKNMEEEQTALGAGLVTASLAGAGAISENGAVANLVREGAKNLGQDSFLELGQTAAGLVMTAGPIGWIAAGAIGVYLIWNALDC